jgi:predicted PhzF superfamily epimerase YddE/YHI9
MHGPSKGYKIYVVDAFTERAYRGNNAAVCVMDHSMDSGWMHDVAAELGQPETAFLFPEGNGYRLRWFTPKVEVMLCGHATLAAAHILWEVGLAKPEDIIVFHTSKGNLKAWRVDNEFIEMDFPLEPVHEVELPILLEETLGQKPLFVGRNSMDYLVELESAAAVKQLVPNMSKVAQLNSRGLIVTSHSLTPDYDYVTRFFAPQCGIPEDPVTGSAQCSLAPYWSEKTGKQHMVSYQASGRGGTVRVRMNGTRVYISGKAVTVLEGCMMV